MCALAISSSGDLIASGQVGTKNFKGCAAPIFLWNAHSYRRLAVLRGLTAKVAMLAFSADEQFLCGSDEVRGVHWVAERSWNYGYWRRVLSYVYD